MDAMLSSPDLKKFKFIDLFCGIGGMRLAYESAGCECVFSSDWDKYAQITYQRNFGNIHGGHPRNFCVRYPLLSHFWSGGFPVSPSQSPAFPKRTA